MANEIKPKNRNKKKEKGKIKKEEKEMSLYQIASHNNWNNNL